MGPACPVAKELPKVSPSIRHPTQFCCLVFRDGFLTGHSPPACGGSRGNVRKKIETLGVAPVRPQGGRRLYYGRSTKPLHVVLPQACEGLIVPWETLTAAGLEVVEDMLVHRWRPATCRGPSPLFSVFRQPPAGSWGRAVGRALPFLPGSQLSVVLEVVPGRPILLLRCCNRARWGGEEVGPAVLMVMLSRYPYV